METIVKISRGINLRITGSVANLIDKLNRFLRKILSVVFFHLLIIVTLWYLGWDPQSLGHL